MKNDLPIQAQAEQRMAETAATFAAQGPTKAQREAESRAYRATHDRLHAEAVAMLRAKGL